MIEIAVLSFLAGAGLSGLYCYRLGIREGKQETAAYPEHPAVTPIPTRAEVKERKPFPKRPEWQDWRKRAESQLSPEQERQMRVEKAVSE